MDAQKIMAHHSMDNSKQNNKNSLTKNHSEYFVTNPHVRELVEITQKSFRNKAAQLLSHGIMSKKQSINKSPEKNITKSSLYKMTHQKSTEKFASTG